VSLNKIAIKEGMEDMEKIRQASTVVEAVLENFEKMRELCDAELKGVYLGISTIKNGRMALTFMDAGADFIICPGLIEQVAKVG